MVYVGSFDQRLYALRAADGAVVWNVSLGAITLASPSVANGVVYAAAVDGIVRALNATTGAQVRPSFATGTAIDLSSPAIANGVLYVGNLDGNVFALA
jgi:outer membrane protein assembly factor BamB